MYLFFGILFLMLCSFSAISIVIEIVVYLTHNMNNFLSKMFVINSICFLISLFSLSNFDILNKARIQESNYILKQTYEKEYTDYTTELNKNFDEKLKQKIDILNARIDLWNNFPELHKNDIHNFNKIK